MILSIYYKVGNKQNYAKNKDVSIKNAFFYQKNSFCIQYIKPE